MNFPVIDPKATGERIRELRILNGYRVEDISHYMGFESTQAVYKWQAGKSLPTIDNFYALSGLFGVTIDEIIVGSKDNEEFDIAS